MRIRLISTALAVLFFTDFVVCDDAKSGNKTKLGQLAAKMKPGQWAELKTENYTREMLRVKNHHIYQYTHDAQWHPATNQLLFVGQGHYSMLKFVIYSAETNAWKLMPTPSWYKVDPKLGRGPIGHAYDNNAIDTKRGILFHHQYHSPYVHRYDIKKGTWIQPLEVDVGKFGHGGHSTALTYFPEMNGLVRVRRSGQVDFWDSKTEKWSVLSDRKLDMGKLHPFVEYNPVHGVVMFGGGNDTKNIYKLDQKGNVSPLKSPPFANLDSTHRYVITICPVSGEFLVVNNVEKGTFYAFNVKKNEWRMLSKSVPASGFMIGTPVSNHGVVMICTYRPELVFLYKHAAVRSAGD